MQRLLEVLIGGVLIFFLVAGLARSHHRTAPRTSVVVMASAGDAGKQRSASKASTAILPSIRYASESYITSMYKVFGAFRHHAKFERVQDTQERADCMCPESIFVKKTMDWHHRIIT